MLRPAVARSFLTSLAAAGALQGPGAFSQSDFHGVTVLADCDPACVGSTVTCFTIVANADTFGDPLLISDVWQEYIQPDGSAVRVPETGLLTPLLEAFQGNWVQYADEPSTPPHLRGRVLLGAELDDFDIDGPGPLPPLPGDPSRGRAVYIGDEYVAQPDDTNPLVVVSRVIYADQCVPGGGGCSTLPAPQQKTSEVDLYPSPECEITDLTAGDPEPDQIRRYRVESPAAPTATFVWDVSGDAMIISAKNQGEVDVLVGPTCGGFTLIVASKDAHPDPPGPCTDMCELVVSCAGDESRVGCTEKGSLLFLSKVEIRWDTAGAVIQDTFIQLTNDYPQDVRVLFYLINGDPPLAADPATGERAHPGWNWLDNEILLTANQPTYWSALTGQPATGAVSPMTALDPGFPPGRPCPDGAGDRCLRGYLVAWAVSSGGEEIRWDHLAGLGTLIHYRANAKAWEYNACAYQVVDPDIAHGAPTGTPGELRLDGLEFAQSFDELLLNFQAVGSAAYSGPLLVTSDTALTLHPVSVDLRQETGGPVTTKADTAIWNENEVKFSGTHRCITCWDCAPLSHWASPTNHFLIQNLHTDHGKARVDGLGSMVCDVGSVISQDAPLLGVAARMLKFDGVDNAAAGVTLVGMGHDPTGIIRHDVLGPPEPATSGDSRSPAPHGDGER